MNAYAFLPAHELALRIRRREISALELLQLYLRRIERHNPAVNAVVLLDADRALQRARAADAALARGETWGVLHGVPMTVKESFNLTGLPTCFGFEAYRDNKASSDALAVQRLQGAGAIVFGKTNLPVGMADWQTFNPVYGTTNNPWDLARGPGGSSGGSAAALAAGFGALELGSDIGASIRNPAHYCGVYGHKPTWGVVPLAGQQLHEGEVPDTMDIGVAGPMARSAFDLALAMDVLASPLRSFGPLGWQPAVWRDRGVPPPRCRRRASPTSTCSSADRPCARPRPASTATGTVRGQCLWRTSSPGRCRCTKPRSAWPNWRHVPKPSAPATTRAPPAPPRWSRNGDPASWP